MALTSNDDELIIKVMEMTGNYYENIIAISFT